MLRIFIRYVLCLAVALFALPVRAQDGKAEKAEKAADKAESAKDDETDDDESDSSPGTGLECSPAVTEVETRRPIPVSCSVTNDDIVRVEARYKAPGKKKFTRLRLKKINDEWVAEIPCTATSKRGAFRLSLSGRDKRDKPVTRLTATIELVDATNEPPPALPGREAPKRCYDPNECPPELKGSAACPGTKATGGARAWGASCGRTSECQTGLACISGTCETPPKCESNVDCSSGECSGGVCQFPDPEELASRLGAPKYNWIGLHFGVDLALKRKAVGVCGNETDDSKDYSCFAGGDEYTGTPNRHNVNDVDAGFGLGTMRALLSYERWFGRLSAGTRIGWAFGGAPKDFTPIHLELRVQYALRKDVLSKRGRPYLGLAGGLAQVDVKSTVKVADCIDPAVTGPCVDAAAPPVDSYRELDLDAYRKGSKIFFGPTLGWIYAFSDESAFSVNVNVMFPDLVFEPAIAYVLGL